MPDFPEMMNLKEKAEEDIYFARLDKELIAMMHRQNLERFNESDKEKARELADSYQKQLGKLADSHRRDHENLASTYRERFRRISERYGHRSKKRKKE